MAAGRERATSRSRARPPPSCRELIAAQRRHRIRALAQPLEGVASWIDLAVDVARLTGDAHFVLDLVVVGLELVEAERPVFNGGTFGIRDAP